MHEENKRRYDDNRALRLLKDFWPILLAIISIVSMYTRMDSRINFIETEMRTKDPALADTTNRVTRLETVVLNLQSDIKDIKLDIKTLLSRTK